MCWRLIVLEEFGPPNKRHMITSGVVVDNMVPDMPSRLALANNNESIPNTRQRTRYVKELFAINAMLWHNGAWYNLHGVKLTFCHGFLSHGTVNRANATREPSLEYF